MPTEVSTPGSWKHIFSFSFDEGRCCGATGLCSGQCEMWAQRVKKATASILVHNRASTVSVVRACHLICLLYNSHNQKIRNSKAWVRAASIRHLSYTCKDLNLIYILEKKKKNKPSMVAHVYNPSVRELETRYRCVSRQPA